MPAPNYAPRGDTIDALELALARRDLPGLAHQLERALEDAEWIAAQLSRSPALDAETRETMARLSSGLADDRCTVPGVGQ